MRVAQIEEEGRGGRRSSMLRSAHPSATIFGFGTAKARGTGKVGIVLVDRHGSVPRTTILTSCQAGRAWAGRRSRLRAAPTARRHGGCTSLAPNLTSVAAATIPSEAGTGRRLCSLE